MYRMMLATATMILSANALAMPAWDGTYDCTANGKTAGSLVVKTVNNKVILQGLTTGIETMDDGLECANKASGPMVSGSVSMSVTSTCDDKSIVQTVSMKSGDTNASILLSIVQTSPEGLAISMAISNVNNPAETSHFDLGCTK